MNNKRMEVLVEDLISGKIEWIEVPRYEQSVSLINLLIDRSKH